ncbi:TPA: hypothetical protein ACI7BJ_004750 [Escherichia coli]|uniref:hypothetical protein n=1 Tax=Escherichia coli TaxID=562 RepID=UPI0002C95785|nr:hypothetical protein [Escherichia coli]EFF0733017.1 hypothetical protein [Escherichia coli]EFG8169885.1 hypothetical protein [Escherichia coli]EFH9228439.1 hypothetical protein [Escherichia coli]EGJ7889327.1 hypothetical protein [Escherichia coli]EHW4677920.1 hypothetical protein [Escherichia coli]
MKMQFLDMLKESADLINAFATSLAFGATAYSAKAAMKATRLAAESLLEMRKTYFKDGYNILFEKHNNILKEVESSIDSNRLKKDDIEDIHKYVTTDPVCIKYVRQITLILAYINEKFYSLSPVDNEREFFIEQLRNEINTNEIMNTIIAVSALNMGEVIFDAKKLNNLLKEYDFFKDALFFKNALLCEEVALNRNGLNKYIYDKYEKGLEEYVDKIVLGIEPCDIKSPFESYNIIDVIFYSYDSQYQKDILYCIDSLSKNIKKYIEGKIRDASYKIAELDANLDFKYLWKANVSCKRINGVKVIPINSLKNKKKLINIYNRYCFKDNNVEVKLTNKDGKDKGWHEVKKELDDYILHSNYLNLNANDIDGILNKVENIVNDYTKKFSLYDF